MATATVIPSEPLFCPEPAGVFNGIVFWRAGTPERFGNRHINQAGNQHDRQAHQHRPAIKEAAAVGRLSEKPNSTQAIDQREDVYDEPQDPSVHSPAGFQPLRR